MSSTTTVTPRHPASDAGHQPGGMTFRGRLPGRNFVPAPAQPAAAQRSTENYDLLKADAALELLRWVNRNRTHS
jgi:hypothetical protein